MEQTKLLPRKEQAAETRQKLLDTARRLFAQNGYAATSVRQLHRTAGLTDGILYHYFPGGKQELFHAIIEADLGQIVSDTLDKEHEFSNYPLEKVLEEIYQIWLHLLEQYYDIFRIMFCEHEVREVIDADELSHILAARQQWFPHLLKERASKGEICEIDYNFATAMVFSVMFDAIIVKVSNIGVCWLDDPHTRTTFFHTLVDSWRTGGK